MNANMPSNGKKAPTNSEGRRGNVDANAVTAIAIWSISTRATRIPPSTKIGRVEARVETVARTLPESVLTRYDRLRRTFDGVAIARLEGGRCLGCHLALSTSELDRIRHAPADAVVECEHCGRLLVR